MTNKYSGNADDTISYATRNIPEVVNAAGTLTSLGGCRTRPEAMKAMLAAADQFIPFEVLQRKMGEHLAQVLGVPAAMVSAGAAPGLTLAAAACMVGYDRVSAAQLPAPPIKNKIIIQCSHRSPFERAILLAGASLVQVGDAIRTRAIDLESAIDDQTAAVVFFLQAEMLASSLSLDDTLAIAHTQGLPVIVDAAAELPPKSNLWELAQRGADLVVFSGGKDLRGPQASGLMVGAEALIESALMQSAPHEHVAGRVLKPGKEAIMGLVAAVEAYLAEDETARFAEWEQIAKLLEDALGAIPGIRVDRFYPSQPFIQPACTPRVGVCLDDSVPLTIQELERALWEGMPPIATEIIQGKLVLNTHTLTLSETEIILERIQDSLHKSSEDF
jgi:L-seryl-tRNA(Ser) seleniumtransferase